MNKIKCCEDCIHIEVCALCTPPLPICDNFKEEKKGYWEKYWDEEYLSYSYRCSECKEDALTKEGTMHDQVLSAYCPRCGVKNDHLKP